MEWTVAISSPNLIIRRGGVPTADTWLIVSVLLGILRDAFPLEEIARSYHLSLQKASGLSSLPGRFSRVLAPSP